MPGFGKHIGPVIRTPEGEVLELKDKLARHEALYAEHVGELVDCLFGWYLANPDPETEKLLIMHMGSEFFSKREDALSCEIIDVLRPHRKMVSCPQCKLKFGIDWPEPHSG